MFCGFSYPFTLQFFSARFQRFTNKREMRQLLENHFEKGDSQKMTASIENRISKILAWLACASVLTFNHSRVVVCYKFIRIYIYR